MKLMIIHQAFASPKDAGGTRHFELARLVVAKGCKVVIVASSRPYLGDTLKDESGKIIKKQNFDGVTVLRAPALSGHNVSFFLRVCSFIFFAISSFFTALKAGRQDVVMGTSPPLFQLATAWLLAKIWRSQFVLELRDLWPDFAIDMGVLKSPILIKIARKFELFLYGQADSFIVNSPAYVRYLESKGIPETKIHFISNGVDPQMFDKFTTNDVEQLREQFSLQDKIVVTYAGALGPANDIFTLLKAAKILGSTTPNAHLLLVGDGKDRRNLEKWTKEHNLTNVTITGPVPKDQMPVVLGLSDVCIAILQDIPMFRTTYPNKVFDYMAASKPVVLAIDGVIREVVERAECGIFAKPGSPESISDAIQRLVLMGKDRIAMGVRGRIFVESHFDRRAHAEQFYRVISSPAS
jgi:glycosyltransferase involved in cell wall biosynthesis